MKQKRMIARLLPALTAVTLYACGGGTVGSDPTPGGIDRLGVNIGTITAFGSIIVNDVRYETGMANFDIDDRAAGSSQSDLSVGDVVKVTFDSINPTVALSVVADEAVEGPVDSINAASGQLIIAGQTVLTTADTAFDNKTGVQSLADIQAGDFLEVSGFFDANGSIQATRIERKPVSGETEVHGVVRNKTANSFMINALVIDYTSIPARLDDNFAGATFSDGDFVEVKGSAYSAGVLLATEIERDGPAGAASINPSQLAEAEIEGLITRVGSATDFDVAGVPVSTSSTTRFEGGSSSDIALNVKVEVEGDFINGVLVASKVEIERASDLRIAALVNSVDPAAGTLNMLGVNIRVDTSTRLEDKSDADIESFSLGQVSVGDYLEIRGGFDNGGVILARSLEREEIPDPSGDDTEVRATVDAISRPFLTIAGVAIDTTGAQFRNIDDAPITADAFFAIVRVGVVVDADGMQTGQTTLLAREIELEN